MQLLGYGGFSFIGLIEVWKDVIILNDLELDK